MRIRLIFDGHICTATAKDKNSNLYNILALCEMSEKVEPNTALPQYAGAKTSDFENSMELEFINPISVNVVIEKLKEIEKNLMKNKNQVNEGTVQ